jgi:methionyl-tRNA formyltransferase
MTRVIAFGDADGVAMTSRHLPAGTLAAVVGAERRPQYIQPLAAFAASARVPFFVQPVKSSASFVNQMASLQPDVIVVNSYSMKLPADVTALAGRAAVNVHGALLPRYRSANPIQWALLNDEPETGVTLHHLSDDIDAGDIIAQRRVPMLFSDTWRDVVARLADATDVLLADVMLSVLTNTAPRRPQDEAQATRYPRRTAADGCFTWDASARHIYNLVRALVAPHPGAFYVDGGQTITIDRFMSIGEILELKCERRNAPRCDGAGLRVCRTQTTDIDSMRFEIQSPSATVSARLDGIDWFAGRAVLTCDVPSARDLLRRVAADELGLIVAV